jgi:hypothetical protein
LLYRIVEVCFILGLCSTPLTEGPGIVCSSGILNQRPHGPDSLIASAFTLAKPAQPQSSDPSPSEEKSERRTDSGYQLQKLKEWRDAALGHAPGKADAAAIKIGAWNDWDLELVVEFVTKLASKSKRTIRRTISRAPIRSRLGLTSQEVQEGNLNRVLKQGALLHTDIAMLKLEDGRISVSLDQMRVALVDGRLVRQPYKPHWEFARQLINEISPSPSEDPLARQWYIASTAYVQSLRDLANARENLEYAVKLFSDDAQILFYAGVLHEIWASPLNQNFQSLLPVRPFYESKKKELEKARKLFRKVIDADPNFAEAYLRICRVEGLLGSHAQAFVALQRADSLIQDPLLSYYVALFRGYEFEMLGRADEARNQYKRAETLYPEAQSPRLALSHLAQSRGDTEGALNALRSAFDLQHKDAAKDDPFWEYDLSHVRNAPELIEKMHRLFGELPR